jgi:glucokinase
MRVLAGDIGGTKTVLALFDVGDAVVTPVVERRYVSGDHAGLGEIVRAFLADVGDRGERACFAIAGPVVDQRTEATNLPWVIDGRDLARDLALGPTVLINDFVAVAYGVLRLRDDDVVVLNAGARDPTAPIAVLGAGTGLGEAFLHFTPGAAGGAAGRYHVIPSEGGHVDFAPRSELEIGLLRWLLARHHRVSYERVVSGLGLRNIYGYLRETGAAPESPDVRAALDRGEDLGAVVGQHALAGTCALCRATIELFVSAYGAEAGNLALKVVARGGVFVAGGIAPKLRPMMADGTFRRAYLDKGRLSDLIETIPAYLVTHPNVGLLGAAVAAARDV